MKSERKVGEPLEGEEGNPEQPGDQPDVQAADPV